MSSGGGAGTLPRVSPAALDRLCLLAGAALFSTGGVGIKLAELPTWWVASLRSGLAGLAILLAVPAARRIDGRALTVGLAFAATMILFVVGNRLTTAASTTFLQSSAPLWLLFLAPLVLRERVVLADLATLVLVGTGLALLWTGPPEAQPTAPDPWLGNVVGLAAGLTWALTLLGLRWTGRAGEGQLAAMVAGSAITFLVGGGVALASGAPLAPTSGDLLVLAWLGLFQIGLAYVLVSRGLRGVPALEASLLLLVEPVLSPVWAWLVLGERASPASLLGGALVLAAALARVARRAPPALRV